MKWANGSIHAFARFGQSQYNGKTMATIRTFIAIPLPHELKRDIANLIELGKKTTPIARWVSESNWHITVVPPQQWEEEEIPHIIQGIQDGLSVKQFSLHTVDATLGPNEKTPRMIWLCCEQSSQFNALKRNIASACSDMGIALDMKEQETKIHITLARFNAVFRERVFWRPEPLASNIFVRTLEVLQSELKPSGAVYTKLGEIELSD